MVKSILIVIVIVTVSASQVNKTIPRSPTEHHKPIPTTKSLDSKNSTSHSGRPHYRVINNLTEMKDLFRFLGLILLSVIGTVGNTVTVSAVMLETNLKKQENVFIANLAFGQFIVSAFVIPSTCIAILAGESTHLGFCYFRWFCAILVFHVSLLTLMAIAVESLAKCGLTCTNNTTFDKAIIISKVAFVWVTSFAVTFSQHLFYFGPDYCKMDFKGNLPFHLTVGLVLVCLPIVITIIAYIKISLTGRDSKTITQNDYPDMEMVRANMIVFAAFLLFWLPFALMTLVGSFTTVSKKMYEVFAWLALSNSCINCYLYGVFNRHFRAMYRKLFHYCFCNNSNAMHGRRGHRTSSTAGMIRHSYNEEPDDGQLNGNHVRGYNSLHGAFAVALGNKRRRESAYMT